MSSESSPENQLGSLEEFRIKVIDIILKKMNGESISIMTMMASLSIYQSIFQPIMKAELMLYDAVGLHTNFPLIGEELIEFQYVSSNIGDTVVTNSADDEGDSIGRLTFCIDKTVKQKVSDKGNDSVYILSMYSEEMLDNVKKRIQNAYNTTYTDAIRSLLDNELGMSNNGKFLKGMTDGDKPEQSKGAFNFIVPNLKPLDALLWMNKRAVSVDPDNFYYVFFERFDGFYFNTIQQMVKYQIEKTKQIPADKEAPRTIKNFYYIPTYTSETLKQLNLPSNAQQRLLTSLTVNKRYSTFEKILGGFFENEYYEIDIFNKQLISTQTQAGGTPRVSIEDAQFNTEDYIKKSLTPDTGKGTKTKIIYVVNQDRGDYPNNPNYFADKYGESLRVQTAFSQINITATALGDTRVQVGDIINVLIPAQQGFTVSEEDQYLKGKYLITDIKHVINPGNKYEMIMNLSRDSFATEIEKENRYTPGTSPAPSAPGER